MTFRHILLPASLLASAFVFPAYGLANEAAPIKSVYISSARAALLAYKNVYGLLSTIRDVGNGKVEAQVRVVSANTHAPVPDTEITLVGSKTERTLDIAGNGTLALPLDPAALADNADLMANKPKGTLLLNIGVVPTLPKDALRYADITDSIEAANQVVRESVPWHKRILSKGFGKLGLCFRDEGHMVQVAGIQSARPASVNYRDGLTGERFYCAAFATGESGIARDSIITAPAGWQPVFL